MISIFLKQAVDLLMSQCDPVGAWTQVVLAPSVVAIVKI